MPIGCWRYAVRIFNILPMADGFKATLHIIPLIAFAGLKSKVREMTLVEINEIARLFRTPDCELHTVLSWLVGHSLTTSAS